jgi:hypothetical protein
MSGSGLWSIQKAVYTKLTGDATLMALVTGVYDTAPDNARYPFIDIGDATEQPFRTFGRGGHETTINIHIYTQDQVGGTAGFKPGMTILDRVSTLLDGQTLTVENHDTVLGNAEFVETLRESDGVTRHVIARFRLIIQDN